MNKVIFLSFNDEKQAHEGTQALSELHTVSLYAGAIITQDADGRVVVRQYLGDRPGATLGGLLMGSLVGLLGPAAAAIDSGSGVLLGAAIDAVKAGITTEFVQAIQNELAAGKTGILAEVDEEWESPIDMRMEALGGTVFRQTRTQLEDAFFEKEIEAEQAQLANLEREKMLAAEIQESLGSAERNARLLAKIDATKRKIQDKEKQVAARIQAVRNEGEAKIALLRKQMISADDEAKAQLDSRLKDIQSEYRMRARKLSSALGRRKKAHAA